MKKLLLLLLVFPLVFGSCSDDKDDETPAGTIEGAWINSTSEVKAVTDKEGATKEIEASIAEDFDEAGATKLEINADKTFTVYALGDIGYGKVSDGKYSVAENVITLTFTEKEKAARVETYKFSLKNNSLQLIEDKTQEVIDEAKSYYNLELYPNLIVSSVVQTSNFNKEVKK